MTYIMVDVEADGPIPGDYSMVCFGAIVVEPSLDRTFYGRLKPISDKWIPEALQVSGFTREETLAVRRPESRSCSSLPTGLPRSAAVARCSSPTTTASTGSSSTGTSTTFSDKNPFGHSSTNLGSLYKGVVKDMFVNFKHLRKTKHTHHPVDDARGNAEALLQIKEKHGLKINLK